MQKPNGAFDHIDVRDLRLLATLIETKSVTRTAEIMGLSQPAASRALEKVRRSLNDRIVVRSAKGGTLTPRGEALASRLPVVLAMISGLFEADRFDPDTADGVVRIAATDYGAIVVGGPVAGRLSAVAPGLGVEMTAFGPQTFYELATGVLDVALYADARLPADFRCLDLFVESYVCLARSGHPALSEVDDASRLERLADFPRAVVLFPDGQDLAPDDVLSDVLGFPPRRLGYATPFFSSAPMAVAASDLVLCVPARAAALLARGHELVSVPIGQAGFTYRLIWHDRFDEDPRHRWIRDRIHEWCR